MRLTPTLRFVLLEVDSLSPNTVSPGSSGSGLVPKERLRLSVRVTDALALSCGKRAARACGWPSRRDSRLAAAPATCGSPRRASS